MRQADRKRVVSMTRRGLVCTCGGYMFVMTVVVVVVVCSGVLHPLRHHAVRGGHAHLLPRALARSVHQLQPAHLLGDGARLQRYAHDVIVYAGPVLSWSLFTPSCILAASVVVAYQSTRARLQ